MCLRASHALKERRKTVARIAQEMVAQATDADIQKAQTIATLNASLLTFTRTFYELLTGNEFIISNPTCREPHAITLCRALTHIFRNPSENLIINIEPGSGKSTIMSFFTAWGLAQYPDSQYMYGSYSKDLATKHTTTIRSILSLPEYQDLYGIKIDSENRGKEYFRTVHSSQKGTGEVSAVGVGGTVTGLNAGRPGLERWSGCLILDDLHKPSEVHSDTIREGVIQDYKETLLARVRGINVPIIYIGQRLHESDICNFLLEGGDGRKWNKVILKSIDDAGNVLYPEKNTKEQLLTMAEKNIYTFASQYQQDPQPAGGSLFKEEMFLLLDDEPKMLGTFIVIDGAETAKTYNDATAFTFFGLYEIEFNGVKTGELALHVIDSWEIWVEPKDIQSEFMRFYHQCMLYDVPPKVSFIEKKSSGTYLCSLLKDLRGLDVREIDRGSGSGSKTQRFINIQPYIAAKQVTLSRYAKHAKNFITHMTKITANETHARDDICDTVADGIAMGLRDKSMYQMFKNPQQEAASNVARGLAKQMAARKGAYTYDVSRY